MNNLTKKMFLGRKAEIYAPVLCDILDGIIPNIERFFGKVHIILLNPASVSVTEMKDLKEIKDKTEYNCKERGDSASSVQKRRDSITVFFGLMIWYNSQSELQA